MTFDESLANFKQRLEARRYPKTRYRKVIVRGQLWPKTIGAKTKAKKKRETIAFRYNFTQRYIKILERRWWQIGAL